MKKEIFFDYTNLENYNNIYVKTINFNNMIKKKKKCIYPKSNSEAFTLINKYENKIIDEENLYLNRYNGEIYNFNINSMNDELISYKQNSLLYYDINKNKYLFMQHNGTTLFYNKEKYITVIQNEKDVHIDLSIDDDKFYCVKQKDGKYFMMFNKDIYKYGGYYEMKVKFKLEKEDGKPVDKFLTTGIKTTITNNAKFIEFKNNKIYFEHNNILKSMVASNSDNKLKLLEIHFYYDLYKNFLILLNKDNKYNINNNNFNSLPTCININILKNIYSTIYNTEIDIGIVKRELINGELIDNKYNYTNGLTSLSKIYFEGNEIISDITKNLKIKNIFKLSDKNLCLQTGFSQGFYSDTQISVVFYKNKYFAYFRINTAAGVRNIEYTSSDDLLNWDKFKILNIDDNNISNTYYVPNIFLYPDTNYLVGIVKNYNYDTNRINFNIIISKDGINFKTISTLLSYKSKGGHHEKDKNNLSRPFLPVNHGLIKYNNQFKLYMLKFLNHHIRNNPEVKNSEYNLCEYTCHEDELFYLSTEYYATFNTKLIKVIDNKIILNYKCNNNGFINVKLVDIYNNPINEFSNFDSLTENEYNIKEISWENNSKIDDKYVKVYVEMYNSNIYSVSGKFYEPNNYYNHIIYKVNDISRRDGIIEGISEKNLNINLYEKFNMNVKKILGIIEYNKEYTKAYINLLLENDTENKILLYNSQDDIVEYQDNKFSRPISIFEYKLINIPIIT